MQFTLFGEVYEMTHAKAVHSLQPNLCRFPIFVPWVFTGKQFSAHKIRLVQRAADESLKAVIDVRQVWRKTASLGHQFKILCLYVVSLSGTAHDVTYDCS